MNKSPLSPIGLMLVVAAAGCIVDDEGGSRGQADIPAASVPDSGSPIRRESAAKTLKDARDSESAADASLEVDPEARQTPPPPVQ